MTHSPSTVGRRAMLARLGAYTAVAATAGNLSMHGSAMAADFPERPVKLISPYAPGGIADPNGRALAEGMAADLGQPVLMENKPGAGTMIGAAVVANAPPNGYNLLIATNATVFNPLLYKKMPYAANDLRFGVGLERHALRPIDPAGDGVDLPLDRGRILVQGRIG